MKSLYVCSYSKQGSVKHVLYEVIFVQVAKKFCLKQVYSINLYVLTFEDSLRKGLLFIGHVLKSRMRKWNGEKF